MGKKKFKHALATDPPPRVDSPPIKIRESPRGWDGMAILSEKQWRDFVDWVIENWELCQSNPEKIHEVAKVPYKSYLTWDSSTTELQRIAVRGGDFWKAGWTGCPLGPSLIDSNSIDEAMKLARHKKEIA